MRRTALACVLLAALASGFAAAGEGPGFPYDPKAIPGFVEQLKDKQGHVRDLARDNLILLGELALPTVIPRSSVSRTNSQDEPAVIGG